MVVRLRPMTEQEFQRWQEASIRSYAAEHVKTGRWGEEESTERARKQFEELLPNGLATEGQHLYLIEETACSETIGIIWVGVQDQGEGVQAFIYDLLIDGPFRRRGVRDRGVARFRTARRGVRSQHNPPARLWTQPRSSRAV